MNSTIFSIDPEQGARDENRPTMQEAGLGEAVPACETPIEQIVAQIQADADSQAYAFIP